VSRLWNSSINVQKKKEKENKEKYIIKKCPVKVLNNDKETARGFKQAYPAAFDQCQNLKLN